MAACATTEREKNVRHKGRGRLRRHQTARCPGRKTHQTKRQPLSIHDTICLHEKRKAVRVHVGGTLVGPVLFRYLVLLCLGDFSHTSIPALTPGQHTYSMMSTDVAVTQSADIHVKIIGQPRSPFPTSCPQPRALLGAVTHDIYDVTILLYCC